MAFKNIARLLAQPAASSADRGLWLSAHTSYPPTTGTGGNELTTGTPSIGYRRVKLAPSISPDANVARASDVEWPMLWHATAASLTPNQFRNEQSAAWPAVSSLAINYGTGAASPGNGGTATSSFIVADLELASPWTLGGQTTGLPPDDINSFGIAKPRPFTDGGFFRSAPLVAQTAPNIAALLQRLIATDDFNKAATDADLPTGTDRYGNRTNAGLGIGQVPLRLAFYDSSLTLNTGAGPRLVSAFPVSRSEGTWPVLQLNAARNALVNRDSLALEVNARVETPPAYWGLEWSSRAGVQVFASKALSAETGFEPVLFGTVRSDAPGLDVDEGVIPPGTLQVRI